MPEVRTILDEQNIAEELAILKDDYFTLKQEAAQFRSELSDREARLNEMIAQLRAGWEAENAKLIETVTAAEAEAKKKEIELRLAIIAAWPGGDAPKTVAPGLSVRVVTKPVYSEQKAIEWAIAKNLPDLLKLDATKFKKAAEALRPDFVVMESSITAVIKE